MKRSREIQYVSLGENCLIDEILKDFKLRKETFPFGSGRFNIEYITEICQDKFEHLFDEQYLRYAEVEGIRVVKNSYYHFQQDIYDNTVCDQVEFTHHDIFQSKIRESLTRKVARFQYAVQHPENFVFLYYYRYSSKRDVSAIITLLESWKEWAKTQSQSVPKIILIHQDIVAHTSQRGLAIKAHHWGLEAKMNTLEIWTGNDLWAAPHDRDLFTTLLESKVTMKYIYEAHWRQEKIRRKWNEISQFFVDFKNNIKQKLRSCI
jgi:hypothetical protein